MKKKFSLHRLRDELTLGQQNFDIPNLSLATKGKKVEV
jgi:hypothetical protein